MTTALEAIRKELAYRRRHIGRLERAEALLTPAPAAVERQPRTPRHSNARGACRGSDHRNPTRSEVRDHIIANAPLTRGEIVAALGGSPNAIDNKLKHLLVDGEIGAEGRPGARRYRAPDAPARRLAPVAGKREPSSSQPPPDRGVYPIYDAIVDLNGATTERLAGQMGLPANLVVEQGRRLTQLGLVRFTGVGDARMWLPIHSRTARDAA